MLGDKIIDPDERAKAEITDTLLAIEAKKRDIVEKMELYSKKNEEYKKTIAEREKELLAVNKDITAAKKSLDDMKEQTKGLEAKLAKATEAERVKLEDLIKLSKQKDIESTKKEQNVLNAMKAVDAKADELNKRLAKLAIDELKISKAKSKIRDLEDKEKEIAIKITGIEKREAGLNEREGKLAGAEKLINETKAAAKKKNDILDGKIKNVNEEIRKATEEREKYVHECKLLERREKAVEEKENLAAINLIKSQKLLEENEVTKKSLEDTRFQLECLDARLNKEIRKRRLSQEVK